MPATLRGIYHNLKESEYRVSNGEIVYYFSSSFYLNKFLEGYQDHRNTFNEKLGKITNERVLNMNTLADIAFYKSVEKRGFCVSLKGVWITELELHKYAMRKMLELNSPKWVCVCDSKKQEGSVVTS